VRGRALARRQDYGRGYCMTHHVGGRRRRHEGGDGRRLDDEHLDARECEQRAIANGARRVRQRAGMPTVLPGCCIARVTVLPGLLYCPGYCILITNNDVQIRDPALSLVSEWRRALGAYLANEKRYKHTPTTVFHVPIERSTVGYRILAYCSVYIGVRNVHFTARTTLYCTAHYTVFCFPDNGGEGSARVARRARRR